MRADLEAFVRDLEELRVTSPLMRGIGLWPGRDRPVVRPFGTVLGEEGWREPFLRYEVDDEEGVLRVTAEVPGVQGEDIQLDVGPDHIRLEARGSYAQYRAFVEPGMNLDPDRVRAVCDDAVLRITIPLTLREVNRVRHIRVHGGLGRGPMRP